MAKTKITPSRRQYLDIKHQHPDAIVFFRLGDFYETFDDDAHLAAKELDLVLTSRPVGKNQRVPMAGVPHHAAEGYIGRLIAKGHKVALCEQIGTETVNGLMPREVVRVFTAGTVIEPGMLDAGRNNYLAAVIRDGSRFGLAYTDITTGEFATTQLDNRRALIEELARLNPAELLLADNEQTLGDITTTIRAISHLPHWRFEEGNGRRTLLDHFAVSQPWPASAVKASPRPFEPLAPSSSTFRKPKKEPQPKSKDSQPTAPPATWPSMSPPAAIWN